MAGPGPNPVFASMRQEAILQLARAEGRVGVAELAEKLSVTTETVRRDLTALERMGLLRRVHGGALPVNRSVLDGPDERIHEMADEKDRIARAALDAIPDGGTILIDAGTTTAAFARHVPADVFLTVVTNDFEIARQIGRNERHSVILVGGRLRDQGTSVVGPYAEAMLAPLLVDVAFMGTSGVSVARGLSTPDPADATTKAAMIRSARRIVVLADHSKIGAEYFQRFAELEQVDLLVVDDALDDEVVAQLRGTGMEVRLA